MAGKAMKSQGTTLWISQEEANGTVYGSANHIKVAKVRSIGEPDGEAAEIDTTDLESTDKEFLMGIPDNGKIPVGMFAPDSDAGHDEMIAARAAQELRWITIKRPNGSERRFKAVVLRYTDVGMEVDGAIASSATLRISGAIERV